MRSLKVLVLSLSVLVLTACPQNKQNDSVRTRDPRNANMVPGGGGQNGGLGGGMNGQNQGQINSYGMNAIQSFVSGFMNPSELGQVQGIVFEGSVTGNGVYQAVMGQGQAQIGPQSTFGMLIYDSYVGQKDSQGQAIPPISVYISPEKGGTASGSIQGGQAQVVFQDRYGSIILVGQVNPQVFQGEIQFQNNGGSSGSLGTFQVATCGFFRCQ